MLSEKFFLSGGLSVQNMLIRLSRSLSRISPAYLPAGSHVLPPGVGSTCSPHSPPSGPLQSLALPPGVPRYARYLRVLIPRSGRALTLGGRAPSGPLTGASGICLSPRVRSPPLATHLPLRGAPRKLGQVWPPTRRGLPSGGEPTRSAQTPRGGPYLGSRLGTPGRLAMPSSMGPLPHVAAGASSSVSGASGPNGPSPSCGSQAPPLRGSPSRHSDRRGPLPPSPISGLACLASE